MFAIHYMKYRRKNKLINDASLMQEITRSHRLIVSLNQYLKQYHITYFIAYADIIIINVISFMIKAYY